MKKLLLVPALLFAACGDNLNPTDDTTSLGTDDAGEGAAATPEAPALSAFFLHFPEDCNSHAVLFEGHWGYADGTSIDNPICHYDFGDGTSSDECFAVHPFPTAQNVVFTVTDPATGATARGEEVVVGPDSFDVTLDASVITNSDGSAIAWRATTHYGNTEDVGRVIIDFDPITNVIIPDPHIFENPFGVVQVTQPGTYRVIVGASIDFGVEGGCSAQAEATVEVTSCSSGHPQ